MPAGGQQTAEEAMEETCLWLLGCAAVLLVAGVGLTVMGLQWLGWL